MPVSKNTLRLMKSLYWIVGIFMHLYVCYILFVSDRAITGVLWLILGLVILFIMYLYYFPPGDASSSWPPYVTSCPDYLTMVNPNACLDFVGLNSPFLKKSDPSNPPQPTDNNYSQYAFDPTGTKDQKIRNAQSKGLTWMGLI